MRRPGSVWHPQNDQWLFCKYQHFCWVTNMQRVGYGFKSYHHLLSVHWRTSWVSHRKQSCILMCLYWCWISVNRPSDWHEAKPVSCESFWTLTNALHSSMSSHLMFEGLHRKGTIYVNLICLLRLFFQSRREIGLHDVTFIVSHL